MKRSRIIFKDVEFCLEWVRERKDAISPVDDPQQYKYYLVLEKDIEQIQAYLRSCEWLVRQEAKQKFRRIIDTNYNYSLVSQEFENSEDAIRTFLSYCNQKAKEKVGENTLDLLLEGKRPIAKAQFESLRGIYNIDNLFTQNIKDMLPKGENTKYTLEECTTELEFMYLYSEETMLSKYEKCDKKKLAQIVEYVESSSPEYSVERYGITRLLTGNGKGVEEMFEKIKEYK